ncbi:hypothetical protein TNCV_4181271 [Trichonephila clavipes]|nr:hypothetical protein TNCV_4181271 [Trichonephila clavipes]
MELTVAIPNIWTLRSSRGHCFLKPFSRHPPRLHTPRSDKPRQLSHSGELLYTLRLPDIRSLWTQGQTIDNDPKATCTVSEPKTSHLL